MDIQLNFFRLEGILLNTLYMIIAIAAWFVLHQISAPAFINEVYRFYPAQEDA